MSSEAKDLNEKKMKTKSLGSCVDRDQKAEGEYTSKDGKNLTLSWLQA